MLSCSYRRFYQPLLLAILLLLVAASRIIRLHSLSMGVDEVWAIWQTFGTPAQVGSWTPVDWTPFYFFTLDLWRHVAGMHPVVLHFFSLLLYLPGCALVYRALRRFGGERAGLAGLLVYTALGYGIYLSTEVRGYTFVVSLLAFVLWMITRYFDRPAPRNAIPLGLGLACMFYFHLSSVIAFVMLGIYTLLAYRQRVWRWWLPGLIAGIVGAPVIISKVKLAIDHEKTVPGLLRKPVPETLQNVASYFGNAPILWLILFVIAAGLLILCQRPRRSQPYAMLIALPIAGLLMYQIMALDNIRYFWWMIIGVTLFIGWGLSYLPRPGLPIVLTILIGLMFLPVPLEQYQHYQPTDTALISNFEWLTTRIRWGDVLIVDPNAEYSSREGLQYATQVYFPNGLQYVSSPEGHRRIWYIYNGDHRDPALSNAIGKGRLAEEFVGPPMFVIQLFEGPPDPVGVRFANGMRFHGADLMNDDGLDTGPFILHRAENVKVRLWWSVDQDYAVKLDYSVGVYIIDQQTGTVVVQSDSAPQVTNQPNATSQWTSNVYYLDRREIAMPPSAGWGTYPIEVAVYNYQDQKRIDAPGVNKNTALPIATIYVKAW